jgi:hypothetical protein
MPKPEIEYGQLWVESQISRLADDAEEELSKLEWMQSIADEERKVLSLKLTIGTSEVEEKFTVENLEQLRKDRRTRARIEHRLKALFRSCGVFIAEDKDDVEDLSEREDRSIEFRYSITSYGADYPVDGLVRRLNDGDIFIPTFQRRFVWSKSQSSRFVESLLLGLPVPAIFLGKEEETNKLLVIDGQQRLRSLAAFYQGQFDSSKKDEFVLQGVASRLEGLSYRTLREADRRRLNDSILHAIVVKQDEPEQDQSSIYLLFERLNTGGSLLHPQEIRACVYHGPLNDFLAKLNQNVSWRTVYGPENERMKDRELILRFFTLLYDLDTYSKPMEGALNRHMALNRRLQRHSADELEKAFIPTIEMICSSLGTVAFRPIRAINAAVFDAVMVGLTRRLTQKPIRSKEQLVASYHSLLVMENFRQAYESSTSSEEHVRDRVNLATEVFANLD